jgi:hypothetical protein
MIPEETKRPEVDLENDPDLVPAKKDDEPPAKRRTGIGFGRIGIDFAVGPNPRRRED